MSTAGCAAKHMIIRGACAELFIGYSRGITFKSVFEPPVFDPERWWESHGGIRTEVEELEKLALDSLRHPL